MRKFLFEKKKPQVEHVGIIVIKLNERVTVIID